MIALIRKLAERIAGDSLEAEDLVILQVDPPAAQGRCWVRGVVRGYQFAAKLYPRHALYPWCELGESRISKLEIRRIADDRLVATFDRGWEIVPTANTACQVLKFLETSLAHRVYGNEAGTHGAQGEGNCPERS